MQIGATIGVHTGPYPLGRGDFERNVRAKIESGILFEQANGCAGTTTL